MSHRAARPQRRSLAALVTAALVTVLVLAFVGSAAASAATLAITGRRTSVLTSRS
jgi:hypothetical protein